MFKPQLESLEDRMVLSSNSAPFTSYTFANGGTVLNIVGNNGSNINDLFLFNTGDLRVTSNGSTFIVDAADFALVEQINITMGKRNDVFRLTSEVDSFLDSRNLQINAWMGSGNDVFRINYDYSDFFFSNVEVNVWGQNGNDDIRVYNRQSDLIASNLAVNFYGGKGNDYLFARTSNVIDIDSTLNYNAWGEKGRDVVRGSHTFFPGSDGDARANVYGGEDKDNLRIEFDFQQDVFDLLTGGGLIDGGPGREKDLITYGPGVTLRNFQKATLVFHQNFVL